MKPAWDKLGETFKHSTSVLVADVDCTSDDAQSVCSDNDVSGYPTIKYFTAETGKKGEDYSGGRDFEELKSFVEETLAKKCDAKTKENCDEKEKAYIDKMSLKGIDKSAAELKRLKDLANADMKEDKKQWILQRVAILDGLVRDAKGEL